MSGRFPTKTRLRITALDAALAACILAAVWYVAWRLTMELDYHWHWQAIPQFLFRFDPDTGKWVPNVLIQGLLTTLRLSLWGTCLAILIGMVMGLFGVSRRLFYRLISRTYVETVRNLPPLVLIFIFYFFISSQVFTAIGMEDFIRNRSGIVQSLLSFLFAPSQQFSAFISALTALGVYEGAYITEIVRAGIESVETGQWEAGHALGFNRGQLMRYVVLPQALQRIIPPLAGQFISTIKDSAIVSVISIQELTFQGMELMSATYLTFEIWITITVLYLALTFSCSMAASHLEAFMSRNRH